MFDPHLSIGQVLSEHEVHDLFECQTTLGIRMSKKNKLFVLISGSAKKQIYHDEWNGDVIYYNGTDINSDSSSNQTLTKGRGNNNKQLSDEYTKTSDNYQIFLFIKYEANKCIYKGEVIPYESVQIKPRYDDPSRSIFVFPLKLKTVDAESEKSDFDKAVYESSKRSLAYLKKIVDEKHPSKAPASIPTTHSTSSKVYDRDPDIAAYVKKRAAGICDLCRKPAPFNDKHGDPYLESHHVIWLSKGGTDDITNAVALCPNCHRRMHIVCDPVDEKTLLARLSAYASIVI